jgi:hypothetical protein
LKKNIKDVHQALELVMQLRSKSFEFRKDEFESIKLAEDSHYGFIAQEVEEILPELIGRVNIPNSNDKNGEMLELKTLNYIEMIPLLTRAIQEQQKMIDEQAELILQLKDQMENISSGH